MGDHVKLCFVAPENIEVAIEKELWLEMEACC